MNDYLAKTRSITYAREVTSDQELDDAELETLNTLFKRGDAEIVAGGIVLVPIEGAIYESVNALVRAGVNYYFARVMRND